MDAEVLSHDLHNALQERFHKTIRRLFFVGIGGSSMSGLAETAMNLGFDVQGSDMCESGYTERLRLGGIPVVIGHRPENLPPNTDLLVFSGAIRPENPERQRARSLGIPEMERSVFIGLLSMQFSQMIAVAGTHGKTTTSAMMSAVLLAAQRDPSVSIGGFYEEIGGNYRVGRSEYFVAEACEYRDSFLELRPRIGIITNIEPDHLDYFSGGIAQIKDSFSQFGRLLPEDGTMICWGDSQDVLEAVSGLKCRVVRYGFSEDADWRVEAISFDADCCASFDVFNNGIFFGRFSLRIPGKFNILNALSVIAAGAQVGIETELMQKVLAGFGGVRRRFEYRGRVGGVTVYEDYAHHPAELKAVLSVARRRTQGRLWLVFQPHTYSRVHYFLDAFAEALAQADEIILTPIYSDREKNLWNVHSDDLAEAVREHYEKPVCICESFDGIVQLLTEKAQTGDFVLVAGSQTVTAVAPMLVQSLQKQCEKAGL